MTDIVKRLRELEKDATAPYLLAGSAADEIERLRDALHRISLGSQNSMHSKEALGREAREALKAP